MTGARAEIDPPRPDPAGPDTRAPDAPAPDTATPETPSDADLISRIRRGEERAFRALYRQHTSSLYRLALRMCGGSDADAQDAVQECWRRAIRGLEGFEQRSSLRTWLSSILVRCALEARRGAQHTPQSLPDNLPTANGKGSAATAGRLDLERAFEALPPGFRAVLILHDVQGYRHADIARLLGVTTGTSKSQLSRARARMRQALGEDYVTE